MPPYLDRLKLLYIGLTICRGGLPVCSRENSDSMLLYRSMRVGGEMSLGAKSLGIKYDPRVTLTDEFPCPGFVAINEIQEEIDWAYHKLRAEIISILAPKVIKIILEKVNPNPKIQLVLPDSIQWEIMRILASSPSFKNSNQKIQSILSNLDLPDLVKVNLPAYLQPVFGYMNSFRYLRSVVKAHTDLFSLTEIEFERMCQNNSLLNKETYVAKLIKNQLKLKNTQIKDFLSFNTWLLEVNEFFNEIHLLKRGQESKNFNKNLSRGNLLKSGKDNYKKRFLEVGYFWYYNEIINSKKDADFNSDSEAYKILSNSVFKRYSKFKNHIEDDNVDDIFNFIIEKSKYFVGLVSVEGLLVDVNSGEIIQNSTTRNLQLDGRNIIVESFPVDVSDELKSSFIETLKIQQKVSANPSRIEISVKNKESYLYIKLENANSKDYNKIISLVKLL